MRYFTKEWYESGQRLHIPVRVSAGAETFSEEYFQKLYQRKLKKWLENMRKAWEQDTADGFETEPWSEENERTEFETHFQSSIYTLQTSLPEEILSMAADIRVLALGVGTRKVKTAIEKHCRANEKRIQKAYRDYRRHLSAMQAKHPDSFIDRLDRLDSHDRKVTAVEERDGSLEIHLQVPYEENVARLKFEDAHILRLDEQLPGSEWLYEEIHENQQGFEIHVLCFNWEFEDPLGEMIVQCSNVIIEEEPSPDPAGSGA